MITKKKWRKTEEMCISWENKGIWKFSLKGTKDFRRKFKDKIISEDDTKSKILKKNNQKKP